VTDADPKAHSIKDAAVSVIDRHLTDLVTLSHAVHATPELCFNETRSAKAVADALRAGGMGVTEGVYDLPTAFECRSGKGELVVAVCAEYDALPDVGHACGHNIIAASAVGAGIALAAVADQIGLQVRVLGTPAEEGGGGKIFMLERGAFEGVNALDAMTISQVALGLLRQQLPPGDQVHGVITRGGGAANVIPASVTGRFMVRSRTIDALSAAEPRVRACFEAGALATGCTVTYEELSPVYSHMEADSGLLAAYRVNAERLGRTFEADDADTPLPTFSTDMANVSLAIPTIHPLVRIETNGAVNHQPDFAAACITPSADAAVRDGAVAMAWTAIDAATDLAMRQRLLSA
jgi:metal-dependent amidase/aminoacylase/carboxypeptidase family protein